MKLISASLLFLILSGCATYAVDRYSNSADTVNELKNYQGAGVSVGAFTATTPARNSLMCRAVGPVKTPDGEPFENFLRNALIAELKLADVYLENGGVAITANLDKIQFDSFSGTWDIGLQLKSAAGDDFSVAETYHYTTSIIAYAACGQTAQAMMPAVQNLISKIVKHQRFARLQPAEKQPVKEPSQRQLASLAFYGAAEEEVTNGSYDRDLWAKALVEVEGDETRRKARYIELRAIQLQRQQQPSDTLSAGVASQVAVEQAVKILDLSGTYTSVTTGRKGQLTKFPNPTVNLVQQGNKINGSYGRAGGAHLGRIYGEIDGDYIRFDWYAADGNYGNGKWEVDAEGKMLEGKWSSFTAQSGDGVWKLIRMQ